MNAFWRSDKLSFRFKYRAAFGVCCACLFTALALIGRAVVTTLCYDTLECIDRLGRAHFENTVAILLCAATICLSIVLYYNSDRYDKTFPMTEKQLYERAIRRKTEQHLSDALCESGFNVGFYDTFLFRHMEFAQPIAAEHGMMLDYYGKRERMGYSMLLLTTQADDA